jgi:hypothetical protein
LNPCSLRQTIAEASLTCLDGSVRPAKDHKTTLYISEGKTIEAKDNEVGVLFDDSVR